LKIFKFWRQHRVTPPTQLGTRTAFPRTWRKRARVSPRFARTLMPESSPRQLWRFSALSVGWRRQQRGEAGGRAGWAQGAVVLRRNTQLSVGMPAHSDRFP